MTELVRNADDLPLPEPSYVIGGKGYSGSDMRAALRAEQPVAAQPAEAQQEPVARVNADGFIVETGLLIAAGTLLYAAPPAPAAVPPGYVLVPIEPTPEMVAAYLNANDEYWKRADELPPSLFKWRNGTPKDATVESYRAMIAAAGDKT